MSEVRLDYSGVSKRVKGIVTKSFRSSYRKTNAGISLSILFLGCTAACNSWGGGSGLNTVVITNQNSPNSLALANYFCEARRVPPDNVLRIPWPGGSISWSSSDFQNYLVL